MRRDPFAAIADPTRRQILTELSLKPMTINEIATRFEDVSRQAVSKQVKFLENSGLLKIEKIGRERYCTLHLAPLREVNDWVTELEKFWEQKLDNLENYLQKQNPK